MNNQRWLLIAAMLLHLRGILRILSCNYAVVIFFYSCILLSHLRFSTFPCKYFFSLYCVIFMLIWYAILGGILEHPAGLSRA